MSSVVRGMRTDQSDEPCQVCQHSFDQHKLIARGTPIQEGFIVCPEEGCYCLTSFDVPDRTVAEDVESVFQEGTLEP